VYAGLVVAAAVALGVAHVLKVAPRYHVGSFDDDASYIMAARALLAGRGLSDVLPSGVVLVGLYPPGYALLLVPVLWLFGNGDAALRGLSVACFAACFPLTWVYLGRRRVPEPVRIGVLLLMAASPVFATFGSMVMAEAPFVVVFLVMLLLLERWERSGRTLPVAGVGAIVALAGLVWLKEAAVAMVAGVAVWLLLQRRVRQAVAAVVGTAILLTPVVAARLVAGVPLAGARYSQELGLYYSGTGLRGRLGHVVSGFGHYLSTALPATVVPYGAPLPQHGFRFRILTVLAWQVTVLCAVGVVVWVRRYRDAAVVVVPVYLAETLLWPYVNERRVILVLPVILAWYVLGAWTLADALLRRVRSWTRRPRLASAGTRVGLAALAALLVVVPLARQWSRDYLFDVGQDSSQPSGSRYIAVLAGIGRADQVVETDYRSTVGLLSGHRTADSAFIAELRTCDAAAATTALAEDDAGFLLLGAVNKPGLLDNSCLMGQATTAPWAVRLLRTSRDLASVFELIGPGTAHPDLTDATASAIVSASGPLLSDPVAPSGDGDTAGVLPATVATGGAGTLTWSWPTPASVRQVSVGEAGANPGPTGGVRVELRAPSGAWVPVAGAPGSVGDLPGATPDLLVSFPSGLPATGLRVVITGTGQVSALDVHALAGSAAT
jgi:hypothetical protein